MQAPPPLKVAAPTLTVAAPPPVAEAPPPKVEAPPTLDADAVKQTKRDASLQAWREATQPKMQDLMLPPTYPDQVLGLSSDELSFFD